MILKFDEYFVHVLKFCKENGPTPGAVIRTKIQDITGVTHAERAIVTEKGTLVADSRIYWAIQYLFQAGALNRPSRGIYEITDLGIELLVKYPNGLTEKSLKNTEGYQAWVARIGTNPRAANTPSSKSDGEAPQESIETALTEIENNLSAELVKQIQDMSPEFLEKSVLKLLGAMGYGVDSDSLQHTGGPGDEGIDGIINQDKLGIQRIYIQAKRYKTGSNISRETIQSFIGALQGASGGVFITTSMFTAGALDFASKHLSPKIVLIDGPELGRLMLKYEIGVIVRRSYKLMEVDENFFSED
jgi:restriction system protein